MSDWKAAAVEKIRDLRYGGSNEVLPDGSFSGLGSFQPKGDAVLTVTMSQPESYYLRGFIGSDYTGDGWKDTDAVKLWKSRDLFYWLHRDGFYGQETLSDAALIFGSEEDRTQKNNITVKTPVAAPDTIMCRMSWIAVQIPVYRQHWANRKLETAPS